MQLLEDILGSKSKIKIIRFLLKHKNWEFNITELSKDLGINKGNISKLIRELEKDNLLIINRKGRILLLKLNLDNRFVKDVLLELFRKEDSFFDFYLDRIVSIFKNDKNIISIVLYGSVARGDAKLKSDIDILLIVKKETNIKEKLSKIDDIVNIDIITLENFRKSYVEREPLIMKILDSHKILYGKKLLEIA